jgi:hypothetical protein
MSDESHVCGALNAILTQCQLNLSSFTSATFVAPCESSFRRAIARTRSSPLRNLASAGVCGMKKKQVIPKAVVMIPSTRFGRLDQYFACH